MEGLQWHHHGHWTGSALWESARALATLLSKEPARVQGMRIVELGSGCGLLGLVAGMLGASEVTLTDEVVALAQYNVDVNCSESAELKQRFKVRKLCWGMADELSALAPHYDVILGSDILYFDSERQNLASTLIALSGPGTKILISGPDCLPSHQGLGARTFFSALKAGGIEVSDIPLDEPKAKRMKINLDTDRGDLQIVEMTMREEMKAASFVDR